MGRWRTIVQRHTAAIILCGAASVLPCMSGCAFRSAPADEREHGSIGTLLAADQWPERETQLLSDMVRVSPTSLTIAYPVSVVVNGRLTSETRATPVTVVESGVYGRGIVRHFEPADNDPEIEEGDRALKEHLFGGLQFISFPPDPGAVRVASTARESDNQSRYRRFLLRRLGIRPGRDDTYYLMRQGTRMRLFEPSNRSHSEARGIVIHLSSLAGFDYEKPVIDHLCGSGWVVLQVDASTARRQDTAVRADISTDLQDAAEQLARSIDNRVAEIAYASEAGLDYLLDTHPELQDKPVAIAGYSAGALVAPSVATLLHDRIRAVVLVGGGANLLNIARRSSLTNGGIKVRWEGIPAAGGEEPGATETEWKRLEDAYLNVSRLDPYNTAPFLLDKPVLVLHGIFDDIVPADTGETLYKRLGQPERYVYTLGHRGLFWRLPSQAGLIDRWLNRTVRAPLRVGDTTGAGSDVSVDELGR